MARVRSMTLAAAAGFALVLGMTACGSSSGGRASTQTTPSGAISANASGDARYTEEQVAKLAHLHSDGSIGWISPGGCDVDIILTSRAAVHVYADAGDPVVSNPAGDVGVKFGSDPGCRQELLRLLARVP